MSRWPTVPNSGRLAWQIENHLLTTCGSIQISCDTLRHQVLSRDGWRCQSCGSMSNLEVLRNRLVYMESNSWLTSKRIGNRSLD
jgi:hypothetical protein